MAHMKASRVTPQQGTGPLLHTTQRFQKSLIQDPNIYGTSSMVCTVYGIGYTVYIYIYI